MSMFVEKKYNNIKTKASHFTDLEYQICEYVGNICNLQMNLTYRHHRGPVARLLLRSQIGRPMPSPRKIEMAMDVKSGTENKYLR